MYGSAVKAYINTQISTNDDPKQLILMLYNGAIRYLEQAKLGIKESNIKRRGEGLSRTLKIIGELNSCLNVEAGGETASFLRGLYLSMLTELPQVNLNNDIETIERTIRYFKELKKLWEERVLLKTNNVKKADVTLKMNNPILQNNNRRLSFAV